MNNSKFYFSVGILSGICCTYLVVGFLTVFYESHYATSSCTSTDREWAQKFPDHYVFERISLLFLKTQCRDNKPLLLISASEGTMPYKFSQAFKNIVDMASWEIRGAHRGIKILTYLLSLTEDSMRIKDQKIVAFINPVYFGFAARTDDAGMFMSASSQWSFLYHVPHWKYKYRDLILTSPFYGFKGLLEEHLLTKNLPTVVPLETTTLPSRPDKVQYNLKHNMLNERLENYKSAFKKDKFNLELEPTSTMLEKIIKIINDNNMPICLVFLPLNEHQLSTVRDDHKELVSKLKRQVGSAIPETLMVNLMDMGDQPYLFADSMHFTNWGVHQLSQAVINSDCYKRITN